MITNYHTLKHLIQKLKPILEESTIVEAFTQEKDTLHIAVEKGEIYTLELNATGRGYMFLRSNFERARKNSLDIFPEVHADKISKVKLHHADRLVEISLESGKKIILQFFTGKVNFFLVTKEYEILASFKEPKLHIGRRFEFFKNESNYHIMVKSFNLFKEHWEKVDVNEPVQKLLKIVDTIDSLLAREILFRSASDNVEKIWHNLVEIDEELNNPTPKIYYDRYFPKYFSIVELKHLNLKKIEIDDINEAIKKFVIETKVTKKFYEEHRSIAEKLHHFLEKANRTIQKIEEEINENKRARMYEIYGSILMANLDKFQRGDEEVELLDIFSENGGMVKIKLDPSLSPVENAQKYFEKAKRVKASLKIAEERLYNLKLSVEKIKSLIERINRCTSLQDLKKFKQENLQDLKAFGIVKDKIAEKIGSKFRRFIVDGGFEVWVGKDAKSNDLLTLKFADKEDYWFHARGVRGAHVILKTGKRHPSKKAIEQASEIAAYFSDARTSSLVPVIVTKRKYVRKPKGAPEGSVIVEREEVIMVEPKLPFEEMNS